MRILLLLAALISGCLLLVHQTTANVKVLFSEGAVNEGSELHVTCRAESPEKYKISLYKVVPAGNGREEVQSKVLTLSTLEEPYQQFKDRYTTEFIEVDKEKEIFDFKLIIANAQVKDGGYYRCVMEYIGASIEDAVVTKDVLVRAPPSEVKLVYYKDSTAHEVAEGEEVTFAVTDTAHFKCIVNGSNPEPMARMVIGDSKLTSKCGLVVNEPKSYMMSTEDDYQLGLIRTQFDTVLEVKDLKVVDHPFQTLTCAAHTHHFNPPELSASLKIKVTVEKPEFICNDTQKFYLYQKDASISCLLITDVPAEFSWYTYRQDKEDESYKITIPVNDRISSYYGKVTKLDPIRYMVNLEIKRVHTQHFRPHWIVANSSYGTMELKVDVQHDPTVEVHISGAWSMLHANGWSFVLLSLQLLLLLQH